MNSTSATAYVVTFAVFGHQRSHDHRMIDVGIFAHALPHVGLLHYSPAQSSSLCRVCMLGTISDARKDLMNEKIDGEIKAGSRWVIHPSGL